MFVAPLPVHALVKASKADNAIAAALLAKRNPVLLAAQAESRSEGLEEGRARGLEEGARYGLLAVLHARGLPITAAEQARVEACRDE